VNRLEPQAGKQEVVQRSADYSGKRGEFWGTVYKLGRIGKKGKKTTRGEGKEKRGKGTKVALPR